MNGLLDTNILLEAIRPRPEPKVLRFLAAQPLERLHISIVTFAEIRYGIECASDPARRLELQDWLTHRLRPMFAGRVLPILEDVMLRWRHLLQEGRRVGHTFPQPDLIIAATALHNDLTIVTRDSADFARTPVPVFNPWVDKLPAVST